VLGYQPFEKAGILRTQVALHSIYAIHSAHCIGQSVALAMGSNPLKDLNFFGIQNQSLGGEADS